MSERTERCREALTDEWMTTQQVADAAGETGRGAAARVYSNLKALVRDGLAEERVDYPKGRGAKVAMWRRKA